MDPDGLSRAASSIVDAGTLIVLLASVLVAVVLAVPFAARWRTSRRLATLSFFAVGAILAATIRAHDVALLATDPGALLACAGCSPFAWITDAALWARAARVDAGWLLNVVLFVPAGFLFVLATRRPWRVLVGLVALSLLIEVVQDLLRLGAPDPADLIANALGAGLGVGAGGLAKRVAPGRFGVDADARTSRRRFAGGVAIVVALVTLGWLGIQVGADLRRDELAADLETAFASTTAPDIEATLAREGGADALFASTSTWPMYLGRVGDSDEFEGFYATQFFGAHRCVTIRWSADGFTLRDGSGDTCTTFRDRPSTE